MCISLRLSMCSKVSVSRFRSGTAAPEIFCSVTAKTFCSAASSVSVTSPVWLYAACRISPATCASCRSIAFSRTIVA